MPLAIRTPPRPTHRTLRPGYAPTVLVIGALHQDLVGRLNGEHRPAASNPVRFVASVGGVAANVARAVAAGGARCRLIAPDGDDAGRTTRDATGIDPLVLPGVTVTRVGVAGCAAGRYVAILDTHGELVAGYSDTRACELATAGQLMQATPDAPSAFLVLDANLNSDALAGLATAAGAPIAALAVSPTKAQRLLPIAARIAVLFCNRREAVALTGLPERSSLPALAAGLHDLAFSTTVLTDGPGGVLVTSSNTRSRLDAPDIGTQGVIGVNGAGDALAGATLAALVRRTGQAGRMGRPGRREQPPAGTRRADAGVPTGWHDLPDPDAHAALVAAVDGAGRRAARDILLAR